MGVVTLKTLGTDGTENVRGVGNAERERVKEKRECLEESDR